MDIKVECPVCYDRHDLAVMNFYWCGHGFCSACIPNMRNCAYNCTSNTPTGTKTRKIFVNTTDAGQESKDERVTRLVDGLNRVEPGFPDIAYTNASKKIKEILDDPGSRISGHIAASLRDAANNLLERISTRPSKEERLSEGDIQRVATLEKEVEVLNEILQSAERIQAELASGLADSRREVQRIRSNVTEATGIIERQRETIKRKERDIVQLRADMLKQKEQVDLYKRKAKALAKGSGKPKVSHNPDDSLLVEPPDVADEPSEEPSNSTNETLPNAEASNSRSTSHTTPAVRTRPPRRPQHFGLPLWQNLDD